MERGAWSGGDASPPNILNLDIEVNDFMTPQPIYSMKIFVSLCQELSNLMTPQGIYSVQIFVSLLSRNSGQF